MTSDKRPPQVSVTATQGGETRTMATKWQWVEPTIWTDRMLEALENGVKGGKWFSLIDKVFSPSNLEASWNKVKRNHGSAGIDRQTVEKFSGRAPQYLGELREELKEDRYRPMPVLRKWISKPGTDKMRPLGIPAVKDRVVQAALRHVMEPIWEKKFSDDSYGFRPGRSCKDALRRVDDLLRKGYTWIVDVDVQSYFDTINHEMMMEEVRKEIADGRVLTLIERFLKQRVTEDMNEWTPEKGTPQGAVISPLMANIFLHPVDMAMKAAGYEMTRYADDMVIQCRNEEDARRALAWLDALMTQRELTLHPEKTRIVDALADGGGGFDFLGYHFESGHRYPRSKSLQSLRDRIRERTRRTAGVSLTEIITTINPILKGWFGYFKHSHKFTFGPIDGWVRMRLRSILRQRHGGQGRGRGNDHYRWPNAYFVEHGLFALKTAHATICKSR